MHDHKLLMISKCPNLLSAVFFKWSIAGVETSPQITKIAK